MTSTHTGDGCLERAAQFADLGIGESVFVLDYGGDPFAHTPPGPLCDGLE
ncbi:hypothetical protein ABT215_03505 [Streptomyces sp900105755]